VDGLRHDKCAVLLLATLLHDIGMLSQRPEDLPDPQDPQWARGYREIADWVRRTHIHRIDGLVHRLFRTSHQSFFVPGSLLFRSLPVAKAHGYWPWESAFRALPNGDSGLAAIVAVADLLDEDSNRCDTKTLIDHRQATLLNIAHWMRHSLTANRVLVDGGVIRVQLARPPGTVAQLNSVYAALRNHYRLALAYGEALEQVGAGLLAPIEFDPANGTPTLESQGLEGWHSIQGLATQPALVFHLLTSFMPEALLDGQRLSVETINRLRNHGLETVDLTTFHAIRGNRERRLPEELVFRALMGV
jgi:hypothetical protein